VANQPIDTGAPGEEDRVGVLSDQPRGNFNGLRELVQDVVRALARTIVRTEPDANTAKALRRGRVLLTEALGEEAAGRLGLLDAERGQPDGVAGLLQIQAALNVALGLAVTDQVDVQRLVHGAHTAPNVAKAFLLQLDCSVARNAAVLVAAGERLADALKLAAGVGELAVFD